MKFLYASLTILLFSCSEKKAPEKPEAKPVGVQGFVVNTRTISQYIYSTGTINAVDFVNISSEVNGKITSVNFKDGEKVQKGKLLLKINADELQAQLNKLQAQLELNNNNLNRLQTLLKSEGVSQQEFDVVNTNQKTLQADINLIKAQIEKTEIRAPFDGVLGFKNISNGQVVAMGTPIVSIYSNESLNITTSFSEKYVTYIKEGDELKVKVEGLKDTLVTKVQAIEPDISTGTRTINVRGLIQNKTKELKPGMFATVMLKTDTEDGVYMVPAEAIIAFSGGKQVFVSRDGKVLPVIVETGTRTPSMVEIRSDKLQIGDTIITTGLLYLKPGAPVSVKNIQNPAAKNENK